MYYIYKIQNLINHKKYIGLTNNIQRRKLRHFTDLRHNKHDNSFLQKEFNIYGEQAFSFEKIFEGEVTPEEIGLKEKEYIAFYDSYKNGYNQNEGGNFGPTNGGTHLTESDVLNILAALEFMSRPGQALSDMFQVSKTTISRIKQGVNHCQYKEYYDSLSYEQRKAIYDLFCETTNFCQTKWENSKLSSKRKFTEEQVHLVWANEEYGRIIPLKALARRYGVTDYALACMLNGNSYNDYALSYTKLTKDQKDKLVTLLKKLVKEKPLKCGEAQNG